MSLSFVLDLVCGKQDGSSVGEKCCASENADINHMAPQISTSDRTANNSTISNTAFTTSYNEGAVNGSMEYWSTNLHPGPNKLYYNGLNIYVINSITECDSILSMIPQSLLIFLGVDCEWAQPHHIIGYNEEATSKDLSYLYPVAMVQMATTNSQIYLIRLSRMNKQIPRSLVEILENPKYLKFGVNVMYDMERLRMNFKVDPKGAVDLRHLALGRMQGERMSLQALGKYFLGIELDKSYALQCSNWQCLTLDREQIIYAAMDAKVSLNIFLAIILIIMKQRDSSSQHNIFGPLSTEFENCATSICHSFIDVPFTYPNKHREHGSNNNNNNASMTRPERARYRLTQNIQAFFSNK